MEERDELSSNNTDYLLETQFPALFSSFIAELFISFLQILDLSYPQKYGNSAQHSRLQPTLFYRAVVF